MFLSTIKHYIEKFKLLQPGDRVLLGISGGLDSIALLEFFYLIKREYNIEIFVSHYDHKIRKNSHLDALFVYKICREKRIPFFYTACCVPAYAKREKLSLEMAGRELRYNLWYYLAKKYDFHKIALAHHLDDLAEEIFLRIIRGTGKRGLAGIPIKREDLIVRPFLFVTKEEIKKFAEERGLTWLEDPTNQNLKFLRNKVRHLLIPYLEQNFNKNIKNNLKKIALIISEEEELIEEQARKYYQESRFYVEKNISLKLHVLKQIHPVLRKRIYFLVFQEVGVPLFRVNYTHLESLENLITKHIKGPVNLPGDYVAYRGPGYIVFSKKIFTIPYFEVEILKEGEYVLPIKRILRVYKTRDLSGEIDKTSMVFSSKKLTFPFVVRKRKPGDKIYWPPIGHKKLKKFFQEKKIPSSARDPFLIIEHQNDIVGVWGLYVHPDYKPTENEFLVLKLI